MPASELMLNQWFCFDSYFSVFINSAETKIFCTFPLFYIWMISMTNEDWNFSYNHETKKACGNWTLWQCTVQPSYKCFREWWNVSIGAEITAVVCRATSTGMPLCLYIVNLPVNETELHCWDFIISRNIIISCYDVYDLSRPHK